MPPRHRLQINRVHVLAQPGAERTILFSHGFGTTQEVWQPLVERFRSQFNILVYDIVGATPENYPEFSPERYDRLDSFADDLIEICDALNLKGTCFVGHSMSGMIGMAAAVRRPELFSKLVLIGASARYLDEPGYHGGFAQADIDQMCLAMRSNYYAWASGFGPAAMGNPERPELGADFARTLQAIRPDIALAVLKLLLETDFRPDLPRLAVPTLIVQSEHDIAVPLAAAQYLHDNIHQSKLVIVQASGHLPHVSAVGEVADALRAFL